MLIKEAEEERDSSEFSRANKFPQGEASSQNRHGNDALTGGWGHEVVAERGTDEKIAKTKLSWVYRVLYLLKYSLSCRLLNDRRRLVCIAIYANPTATKSFFGDLFYHTYEEWEFIKDLGHLQLGFAISQPTAEETDDCSNVVGAGQHTGITGRGISNVRLRGSPLHRNNNGVTVKHDALRRDIPFNVSCGQIMLSKITIICGEQGSGKTTLLNAIFRAWVQGEPIQLRDTANYEPGAPKSKYAAGQKPKDEMCPDAEGSYVYSEDTLNRTKDQQLDKRSLGEVRRSAYKLEYYNIVSQYVGCGESYLRSTFQKARNNRPALVVIDQVELLFQYSDPDNEDRQSFSTLARTLINELHALDEGVAFVAATSGNVTPQQLPTALKTLTHSSIVLKR
ncbi:ATPase AAA [Babesia ovata]|uniref:ATPase AAA n=1 Tax=Babesia ovata TaxID=189622 RepID=A0A2H6KFE9_9APIC|nr:ATPase AAA [Babesia ovata]GBE61689.1 ATPase AAA [Babesia ovata]